PSGRKRCGGGAVGSRRRAVSIRHHRRPCRNGQSGGEAAQYQDPGRIHRMNVSLETRSPADAQADVLIIGRHSDSARPTPQLASLDKELGGLLPEVLKSERFEGKAGQVSHFLTGGRIRSGRVLVVGLGPKKAGDAEAVRRGSATAIRRARDLGASTAAVYVA